MSWTQKNHNPHTLIELSTLTGACMVALVTILKKTIYLFIYF